MLKMKADLALSVDQETSTQRIFEKMREDAVSEGKRLIAGELALEIAFREGSITEANLRAQLRAVETIRANLGYIHLTAHLEMMRVLTELRSSSIASCGDTPADLWVQETIPNLLWFCRNGSLSFHCLPTTRAPGAARVTVR
ncbi:hypothetical protein [Sinorhizobium meliloti]|uniref:hypothetical protein n=1 Tax=Rhizobium meliloti TaxID=382 RepID=UPI0001E4BC43|nr:hypothetical protein [Sinorhizobium meliloti]MCO6420105.1 hypothetical protein [Sinorhizobium meliloti]MDE4549406.1 hypothetical protein [Sinorhizobium meliloti]MDE4569695.1 hypothetical protein [Sinorhizobium meliloti]UFX10409.1 hypothetical protein SmelRRI128_22965 [Sinorhizobium meliloti]SDW56987.1 hypothetical protein SAMN04244576_00362 [Sinorhizobium meliloti]